MPFIPTEKDVEIEGICSDDPREISSSEFSLMRKFAKLRLELLEELILWVAGKVSCNPENIVPGARGPDVDVAKREGMFPDCRRWDNLSDNLSPPQASGGVMEEESSLRKDVGVEDNCAEEVSSCRNVKDMKYLSRKEN